MKKIRILSFALVPVILLASLLIFSMYKNDNSDVESAKRVLKDINRIRMAIDKYYLESGKLPDLVSGDNRNNLTLISFKDKDGIEKTFNDFLKTKNNRFPETPQYKNLVSTNKIIQVDNFNHVTKDSKDGGWNYNIKTGEIHANIPYNYFNQSIDWNSF